MVKVLSAMEHKADYLSNKIECHQDEKDKPFPVSEKALVDRGVKNPALLTPADLKLQPFATHP